MNKIALAGVVGLAFLVGYLAADGGLRPASPPAEAPVETKPAPPSARPPKKPSKPGDKVGRTQRTYATAPQVDKLRALPYADASYDPDGQKKGVTLHAEDKAFDGLNFYSSRDLPAAFLIDMKGKFVYQWRRQGAPWQHVDLLPTGEVLALRKENALIKIDLDSKLLWTYKARVHHDHWRTADGTIYVLARRNESIPEIHPRHKILVDYVLVLSPEGQLIDAISTVELVARSPFAFLLPSLHHLDLSEEDERPEELALDVLHANHVEVFDGSLGSGLYAEGNVLLSFRNINTIAVADLEKRAIVWAWGPSNLTRQHHPVLLPSGNFLIFNNGSRESQILELDPRTREVVWSYGDGESFFSVSRGSNQRLANGNTLVTESDTGYVFEVTPDGETVWEFANPQINDKSERSAIWRMVRFRRDELPFLESLE